MADILNIRGNTNLGQVIPHPCICTILNVLILICVGINSLEAGEVDGDPMASTH